MQASRLNLLRLFLIRVVPWTVKEPRNQEASLPVTFTPYTRQPTAGSKKPTPHPMPMPTQTPFPLRTKTGYVNQRHQSPNLSPRLTAHTDETATSNTYSACPQISLASSSLTPPSPLPHPHPLLRRSLTLCNTTHRPWRGASRAAGAQTAGRGPRRGSLLRGLL